MSPSGPRKKEHFVIPNPRCLRVRDLLFARRPRKSRFLTPFKNRTGFGMTYFFSFSAAC